MSPPLWYEGGELSARRMTTVPVGLATFGSDGHRVALEHFVGSAAKTASRRGAIAGAHVDDVELVVVRHAGMAIVRMEREAEQSARAARTRKRYRHGQERRRQQRAVLDDADRAGLAEDEQAAGAVVRRAHADRRVDCVVTSCSVRSGGTVCASPTAATKPKMPQRSDRIARIAVPRTIQRRRGLYTEAVARHQCGARPRRSSRLSQIRSRR